MPWTIPDKGEGDNDLQSIMFQEYLDVLVDGINGRTCVVSGCAVTGGADMTPEVTKGAVLSGGVLYAIAAATVTIGTADGTNPRLDLVVVTSAGSLAVRAGTAAASPKPPARSSNDVVLAVVYVPASDTTIATTQITDLRVIRNSDVVLKNATTRVTFNTTLAIQTYASLTCPSGMLASGSTLRVRLGGNYLSNSGTPTWTLTIAYGGTTLYQGVTVATAADTDRKGWGVDFYLTHTAAAAQHLSGLVAFGTPAAIATAPATGIGPMLLATAVVQPIATATAGTSVDSDAANRDLVISWTMNVSNAAVETVCNFATFELL